MVSFVFVILVISFLYGAIYANVPGSTIPVLVLDVDGTLYDNDCHIESQIVSYNEEFVARLGIDKVKCESIHSIY